MSKQTLQTYPLLDKLVLPSDLKKIPLYDLPKLASEIRRFLVETLDQSGGHFASSLGALELSIALHYVYDTPSDRVVWDVGHQAYIHKILTGRKSELHTIKKAGGLSPFPKRTESEYDAFGVGHSSTSISAALGMSEGLKHQLSAQKSVAVIGDGAMTAGLAFEGLNHAGGIAANLTVVLNDNEMSISKNVGALSKYMNKFLSGSFYRHVRETSKSLLKNMPSFAWDIAKRVESQAKGMVMPANLFEALGFYYIGPIDGHDVINLVETLENLKAHTGPRLLHIITQKGKGYSQAEQDPIKYHHVNPAFHSAVNAEKCKGKKLTYSNVFGQWLCDTAATDTRLMGVTPAMKEGSDLIAFAAQYPDRYYDVAIAEQHALTFAAGLACEGMKPVVAIYSSFLQRAYDQLIHDIALQKLDVLLAIDRAGLVGPDGPTHAGMFDISFLRVVPNLILMTPSDEHELYRALTFGYQYSGLAAVRYPRASILGEVLPAFDDCTHNDAWMIGQSRVLRQSKSAQKLAILAFGPVLHYASNVLLEELDATLVDMRFVKPLDEACIQNIVETHDYIITIEDNVIQGGAGSAVLEYLMQNNLCGAIHIKCLGLPDIFQEHGEIIEMHAEVGLSEAGIRQIYVEMQHNL